MKKKNMKRSTKCYRENNLAEYNWTIFSRCRWKRLCFWSKFYVIGHIWCFLLDSIIMYITLVWALRLYYMEKYGKMFLIHFISILNCMCQAEYSSDIQNLHSCILSWISFSQNSAHIFFLILFCGKGLKLFHLPFNIQQNQTAWLTMMPLVFIRKWHQHLYLARNSLDLSIFCWQSARFYRCMRYNSGCRLVLHAPHTDVHKTILLYTLEYCESLFNKLKKSI